MNNKLIIFDLAGTLIDKGSLAPLIAFEKAFEKAEIPVDASTIKKYMGTNKRDHINMILRESGIIDENLTSELYTLFNENIGDAISKRSTPIPGVPEAIEEFRKRGFKIAVTTGYNREQRDMIMQAAHKHWPIPRPIFCSDDVNKGRPYPYLCFKAMEYHHIKNVEDCVKIGDTLADAKAARNAGMKAYGVTTGSTTRNTFVHAGVPVLDSISELL